MTATPEELRLWLSNEEPNYPELASRLDESDRPALAELAEADDVMLASKAVYLASLLPGGHDVALRAAGHPDPVMRAAAASAVANLEADRRDEVADLLLGRGDPAIEKVAIRGVGESPGPRVSAKLRELADASDSELIRDMSRAALERPE